MPRGIPASKSTRENTPGYSYYSPEHAEAIKPLIKRMMDNPVKQTIEINAKKRGLALNSLGVYYSRSLNYLLEHTPEGPELEYYRKYKNSTVAAKNFQTGCLEIRWVVRDFNIFDEAPEVNEANGIVTSERGEVPNMPVIEVEHDNYIDWEGLLDKFICEQEAPCEVKIEGITLSDEEIMFCKLSCAGVKGVEIVKVEKNIIYLKKEKIN